MKKILYILTAVFLVNTANAQIVLTESFEGTAVAAGWTQEQHGTTAIWYEGNGPLMGSTTTPDGAKYAGYWGDAGLATSLITPELDLSATGNDTLSFYYALRTGATLELFYKTSAAGTWVPISASLPATATWTYNEVNLPNTNTTYYIAFKCTSIGNDDAAVDMVKVTNTIQTNVKNNTIKSKLVISPNPSNGQFLITSKEIKTVEIIDITGKVIKNYQGLQNLEGIDVNLKNIQKGIYFAKITTLTGTQTKKIIVQ